MVEETKATEDRLRRRARRCGLVLRKSRVKTPNVDNLGGYALIDASRNAFWRGERFDLELKDVSDLLDGLEQLAVAAAEQDPGQ